MHLGCASVHLPLQLHATDHVSQHPLHVAFVLPAAWISIKPVVMSQHGPAAERTPADPHHGVLRR